MNVNQSVNAAKAAKCSIQYWEQLFRGRIMLQKSLQIANQLPVVDDLLELAEEEDLKLSTGLEVSQNMLKSLLEELVGQQTVSSAANEHRPSKKSQQSPSSSNPSFADEDEAWYTIYTSDEMLMQSKWRPALTAMHRKVNGFSAGQQKQLKVFQASFWDKIDAACLDESYGLRKSRLPAMTSPRLGLPPAVKDKHNDHSLDKEEYLLYGLQKANKNKKSSKKEEGTDGESDDDDSNDEDDNKKALHKSNKRKRESSSSEYLDLEVYDDSAFYSQLLKHYVNHASNTADNNNNMQGLQELRRLKQQQRKSSSDVDRKASKGRKIRYVVHAKLQNFMFPRPDIGSSSLSNVNLNVAQESLFASLFQ